MEWLVLLVSLALFAAVYLLTQAASRNQTLGIQRAQAEENARALQSQVADREETIEELRAWIAQLREQRREEGESYLQRSAQYENRISELIRQNQNLAERVASLRQEGLPEGGEDFHIEEPEPRKPYSPDLRDFYDAIESIEAQESVEEFIESRRAAGIDDEQILRELEG